jgi:pimeloyl-ACP methyl ester carboxylesterase
MPVAVRGVRRIHYQVIGEGPPLILVPGLGSGSRLFGTLPRRFARAGHACVTFDPVGVAPSSELEGDFELAEAAADLTEVAAHAGLGSYALVGTSLGGKVALHAAAHDPGRTTHLVLLASSALTSPRAERISHMFEILARRLQPEEIAEVMAAFLFGHTFQASKAQLVDEIVRSMKFDASTRKLMVAQARSLRGFDGSALARLVTCPCLCLAGAQDTLTSSDDVERSAALFAQGRFEEVLDAGHTLLLESPRVFERIREFLSA